MGDLKIINLVKNFQGMDRPAVNNVNLDINSGELVAFLGPSGCGKTTILKMITGLFDPDNGDITLDDKTLLTTPTEKRGVVMVFQNYLLFPYMNVNENVGFALRIQSLFLVPQLFWSCPSTNVRCHVYFANKMSTNSKEM